MSIRLIVKGAPADAIHHAGINYISAPLRFIDWPHKGETVAVIDDETYAKSVMEWFMRAPDLPRGAEYPAGTLLWYSGPDGGQTR